MNRAITLIGGAGLGALLMYFYDPDRGKARRAVCRDKTKSAVNKASETAGKMNRDLLNRANGLVAEAKNLFNSDEATDDVLTNRVRSTLGRVSRNVSGIEILVREGKLTLSGSVKDDEADQVLRAAGRVRGISEVNNQLSIVAGSDSGLQPQTSGAL